MKKVLCSLLAILMFTILPIESFAQIVANKTIRLSKGTPVIVKTIGIVSSNSVGDVAALVDQDVVSNEGVVLIKSGTTVIIKASFEKNGATGKAGKILLSGATTTSVDGKTIALNCCLEEKGENKSGLAWGLGIGTGIFTLVGFLFLLIKGGPAEVPSGTIIPNTYVACDYDLNIN